MDQIVLWRDVPKSCRDRVGCAYSIVSCRLLLNVNEITATIEGIGLITPITEARFEELVEIWRKCVILEKGFWDMAISVS